MSKEIKRQIFHLLWVLLVVATYFIPRNWFLFLLSAGFIFSSVTCALRPFTKHLGIFKNILDYFHNLTRDEEKKLAVYFGASTFMLGALVTFWVFGAEIFRIAIIVLAVGDSFSTIVGMKYGSRKLFYNKKKTWEGTLAGLLTSFTACLFLVPAPIAFTAAAVGMLVESAPVELNDNLTIPLAVALVMLVLL